MATKPYYFKHDFEASTDIKVIALESELGLKGYAWYFKSLEALGRSNSFIEISDSLVKRAFARQINATEEELDEFLSLAFSLGLFDVKYFNETGNLASTRFSSEYDKAQKCMDAKVQGGINSGITRRKKSLENKK